MWTTDKPFAGLFRLKGEHNHSNVKKPNQLRLGLVKLAGWLGSQATGTRWPTTKILIPRNEESLVVRLGFLISGGVDGTRTRDPRRDRPVF